MTAPLACRGVDVRIGAKALLEGVTLEFARGAFAAIVGPNGSGKTTLLRALAGIRPPTAGTVLLDGAPIARLDRRAVARRLSYVPQNTWTEFDITVFDAVAMGRFAWIQPLRGMTRADYDAVHAALAEVDLAGLEARTLPTLSGGERQRVFLARALAQEADVLVLDEPTSSLDVGHQLELVDVLVRLHASGKTIIAAMHDLHLVWDAFHHAVVLDLGRVVAEGASREVLQGEAAVAAFKVELAPDSEGHLAVRRRRS